MNIKHLSIVAAAVAALATTVAHADTVSLSNIIAEWYDGSPAANVTYSNNPSVAPEARWGVGEQQSGYDFDVAAQPIVFTVPPSPSPNQVLGTFKHLNFPISAGTSITDIKLRIKADLTIDNGIDAPVSELGQVFDYAFNHWETPNGDDPCADGGANGVGVNKDGCADRVIANWLSTSDDFTVGGAIYTLNVIGFSLDALGTNPFTKFWTGEGKSNDAYLVGNVALWSEVIPPEEIPEPGTVALVGLALLGAASARRRRQ